MITEGSVLQPPDVKHAEKPVGGEQWDAEHHLDAFFPQDRVRDGRGVDAIESNRASARRNPPGKASAERDANALAYLLLNPAGCRRDEFTGALGEQQDRRSVRIEGFLHPLQQLIEQGIEPKRRDRRVGQRLETRELGLGRRLFVQHAGL